MGSEGEKNKRKPHYNISMSRRTRKPQNLKKEPHESFVEKDDQFTSREKKVRQQKSLKQLIEGRCSLAQHFREEEKQQCVVVRPPEDGFEGMRLKQTMVRSCAKILGHLIKVKQESYLRSWRKSALSLKLIEHK